MKKNFWKSLMNCLPLFLLGGCFTLYALTSETGHLIVTLRDDLGEPITNAYVWVSVLSNPSPLAGGKQSDYTRTEVQTDTNGVADVKFRFIDNDFTWGIRAPHHYHRQFRPPREWIKADVEESDYLNIDESTPEGREMKRELDELYARGDLVALEEKLRAKRVSYPSTTFRKKVTLFRKINPQPMCVYCNEFAHPWLPLKDAGAEMVDGREVLRLPDEGWDLKKGARVRPPSGVYDRRNGEVADFKIVRYMEPGDGITNYWGWIEFEPGCGVYRAKQIDNHSFPSTYQADAQATYLRRLPFRSCVKGNNYFDREKAVWVSQKGEYLVFRTRAKLNEAGEITSCNYAKLIGVCQFANDFVFGETVFNPRPNDTNLEADIRDGNNLGVTENTNSLDIFWP